MDISHDKARADDQSRDSSLNSSPTLQDEHVTASGQRGDSGAPSRHSSRQDSTDEEPLQPITNAFPSAPEQREDSKGTDNAEKRTRSIFPAIESTGESHRQAGSADAAATASASSTLSPLFSRPNTPEDKALVDAQTDSAAALQGTGVEPPAVPAVAAADRDASAHCESRTSHDSSYHGNREGDAALLSSDDAINDALATHAASLPAAEVAKAITGASAEALTPPLPSPPSSASSPANAAAAGHAPVLSTPPLPSPPSPATPKLVASSTAAKTSAAPQAHAAASSVVSPAVSTTATPAATTTNNTSAEVAIQRWKESKDYVKLQRELSRLLASMDRTALTDWASQASLLAQLLKTVQTFKDVIGAVELPDGEHFAKSLWRALSPQSVVGVQRKALEVLQTYFDFVNPSYPMTKDLPLVLPALLELLPQATMQVKGDILDLLDRYVVRRMTPSALRATAQGLLAALLSCLEESETSPMYRRAMALVEHVQATLQHEDASTAAARRMLATSLYGAELRGGQVLPAYAWLFIRDAPPLRSPALNVVKVLMAQSRTSSASLDQQQQQQQQPLGMRVESDGSSDIADSTPCSVEQQRPQEQQQQQQLEQSRQASMQPDWVGGDVQTVVSALLNSLQDTQEKTHRLALDVLSLICPLSGGSGSGDGCGCADTIRAAAAVDTRTQAGASPFHDQLQRDAAAAGTAGAVSHGPCSSFSASTYHELFTFEMRALLVAAAVQLLGTRYGTPSVFRRTLQWLTVNPSYDGGVHQPYESSLPLNEDYENDGGAGSAEGDADTAALSSATVSSHAYVRDVTSYILSQGFHMVVQQWEETWVDGQAEVHENREDVSKTFARRQITADLSSLQHTARALMHGTAPPRLGTASSIATALGGGGGGGSRSGASDGNTNINVNHFPSGSHCSTAGAALATPLVWLRALLLLFRYRSSAGHERHALAGSPAAAEDSSQHRGAENTAEAETTHSAAAPFLLYVCPLVLPSLSRLLVEVPRVLARVSQSYPGALGSSPMEELWGVEVRELLHVVPWTSFVQLDVVSLRAVEKLLQPTLSSTSMSSGEGESGAEAHRAASVADHACSVKDGGGATVQLQRRVQHYVEQASHLATALEPALMDATADLPLAAQAYVRASLEWCDAVTKLLGQVLASLAASTTRQDSTQSRREFKNNDFTRCDALSAQTLYIASANGLLRLLVQRMQQLMEPMLDGILATATATGSAVVGADFFSSFLRLVDTRVLRQLRQTTLDATASLLLDHQTSNTASAVKGETAKVYFADGCGVEVQKLLWRLHHTTLRFTSFLAQLHLRCQQQAVVGVLLDCAGEEGAGTRERDLSRQTCAWLTCLCDAATVAATRAPLFFTRSVRLVVDVLLRARGSLLPEPAYYMLELSSGSLCSANSSSSVSGGVAESLAFASKYVLASVVRALWDGCRESGENSPTETTSILTAAADATTADAAILGNTTLFASAASCGESLLVLIAISPACARCLDVCILQSPIDTAVSRLTGLHRRLSDLRGEQRRGRLRSTAVPESATLAELHDPSVLFLGSLTLLDCLSTGLNAAGFALPSSVADGATADDAMESTRQRTRAYLSQAVVRDLPSVLLPLYFSFLCPLVLPTSSAGLSQRDRGLTGKGKAFVNNSSSDINGGGTTSASPAFSATPLTVLLPSTRRRGSAAACAFDSLKKAGEGQAGVPTEEEGGALRMVDRSYRYLEASELVQYLFALLQLPTATEWVRQAMQIPTPNSLRVLLRGLEAQSFAAPEGGGASSAAAAAAAPAREGPSETLFAATALLLLNLVRQSLLSLHWSCMRARDAMRGRRGSPSCSSLDSPMRAAEPPVQRHRSLLLDALACLNRLVELSQTGSRTQPHRTAVHTWQFTSAQLLPLLRMAVQADLHAAQAMLLDHIRSVVLYLDDVTSGSGAASSASTTASAGGAVGKATSGQAGADSAFTSRHWHQHALLRVGVAAAGYTDKLFTGSTAPLPDLQSAKEGYSDHNLTFSFAGGAETISTTPVLDDLKRVPPTVLSNKLLYAMISEVVEHVLANIYGGQSDDAASREGPANAHEVDTLALWLRFYCDVMPYLYRDLVASVEVVVDVLLSVLEPTTLQATYVALQHVSCPISAQVQSVCYAALSYILRFVLSAARAADVENYEAAVRTKESMSWIASTFSQDDPVAQARNSTMWTRSAVLVPIRAFLGRLVGAAVQCLRVCDAPAERPPLGTSRAALRWGYDTEEEEDVAMGWKGRPLAAKQPPHASPVADLREHARRLLQLLSHAAGPPCLVVFVDHWCRVHAAPSSPLWLFETAAQRQSRLRQQQKYSIGKTVTDKQRCSDEASQRFNGVADLHPEGKGAGGTASEAIAQVHRDAWAAKEAAQRAAWALLNDVGVTLSDVTAALTPLLRDATSTQQRVEQQQLQHQQAKTESGTAPATSASLATAAAAPRVAQLLYFVNQLVEAVCVMRHGSATSGGGLTEREANAVLSAMADVVSQWPPEPLSFCCILHTLYCVVAYAKDDSGAVSSEQERSNSNGNGRGAVRMTSSFARPTLAEPPATAVKVYQSKDYSFALCRLLEGLSLNPDKTQRGPTLLLLQLLCQTFYAVLPSSLSVLDNPGRVVDAATRVFQRTLLPALRRGIASVSEAEILSAAPLASASLRVLRAAISGFAPDLTFEKRVQRDLTTLFFAEHFFRYTRGALHEWTLLLRQMCAMDHDFHSLLCERMVPSTGRLSAMMMSRETEALLRERAMRSLAFYTYAVMAPDDTTRPGAAGLSGAAATAALSLGSSGGTGGSAGAAPSSTTSGLAVGGPGSASMQGPSPAIALVRQKELTHLLREQLTYTLQHFASPTPLTAVQVDRKEVFLQPLRSAFLVFRVLLMSSARESPLTASLWPLVWPELLRALSIRVNTAPATASSAGTDAAGVAALAPAPPAPSVSTETLQEILRLQLEALKVLDVDYTVNPAHALAFRWLFTDDASLTSLLALQQQQRHCRNRQGRSRASHVTQTPSPLAMLQRACVVRRLPLVSHLEVLRLLTTTAPAALSEIHLSFADVANTVHELRSPSSTSKSTEALERESEAVAPVIATIQECWPPCTRPPGTYKGFRRPLYSLPVTHYPRLDGVLRAAQAFVAFLQRVNGDALQHQSSVNTGGAGNLSDAQRLLWLRAELNQRVGPYNEVDVAYMQDLMEADLTTTDPDTMA